MADEESVDIKLPGGIEAGAKGQRTPLYVLGMVAVGGLLYFGWVHHDKTEQDFKAMDAHIQKLDEGLQQMIYILALPPDKRERLNIDMPDSLRRKVHRSRTAGEEP